MARIAETPFAVAPEGDGQGNYRVEVHHARRPAWDIYFLNSRTECLLPEDMKWLEIEAGRIEERRGGRLPALAYFHIPLEQYEVARVELDLDSDRFAFTTVFGDGATWSAGNLTGEL